MKLSLIASLFLSLTSGQFAVAEVTCSPGKGLCFESEEGVEVSADVNDLLRVRSDEYLDTLESDQFIESELFWQKNDTNVGSRSQRLRELLGLDSRHLETKFRESFIATKAYGQAGNYVVMEYGTRNTEFDVLHFIIWANEGNEWQIICHSYVYLCPPNSRAVNLSN